MRAIQLITAAALAGLTSAPALWADGHGNEYMAKKLLETCQEADNDARDGIFYEIECEQYIMGYVSALREVGAKETLGICAPDVNTADEVRWAFMRWVYEDFSARTKMTAQKAMMGTLKDNFACS